MATYAGNVQSNANHPALTVQSPSGTMAAIRRAHYWKNSATVGVIEHPNLRRTNNNGVTPANKTDKMNTRSRTATTPAQTWGTSPTVAGNPLVYTDVGDKPAIQNSWRPPRPYASIYVANGEEVGFDSNAGVNTSTNYTLAWSEHDPSIEDRQVRGRRPRGGYWHFFAMFQTALGGKALTTVPKRNLWANYCQDIRRFRYTVMPSRNLPLLTAGSGGTVSIASVVAGVGSITANLKVLRALAATPAGVATITANLKVNRTLASNVAGTSQISGALKVQRAIATVIAGTATVAVTSLTVARKMASVITGAATVTVTQLTVARKMATAIAGTSTVAVSMVLKKALSTVVAGASQILADLTIIGAGPVNTITQALLRRRRMIRERGASFWRKRRNW